MVFVAVDPSFSRTGMVLLDTDSKKIVFNFISPPGKNADYNLTIVRSAIIARGIFDLISSYKDVVLIYEEPLLTSLKASGLGVLSGVIAVSVGVMKQIKLAYTVRPSAVSQTNSILAAKNKATSKKQISLAVIRELVTFLETSYGYTVEYRTDKKTKDGKPKPRQLSHDEAEAAYILIFLLKQLELLPQEVLNKLYEVNPGFRKVIPVNTLNK